VARRIQEVVGGEVIRIVPRRRRRVLGRSADNPDGTWFHHTVVVVGGLVFDGFTGPDGVPLAVYKERFDECDEIEFGF
jgi:hypothetical protein